VKKEKVYSKADADNLLSHFCALLECKNDKNFGKEFTVLQKLDVWIWNVKAQKYFSKMLLPHKEKWTRAFLDKPSCL